MTTLVVLVALVVLLLPGRTPPHPTRAVPGRGRRGGGHGRWPGGLRGARPSGDPSPEPSSGSAPEPSPESARGTRQEGGADAELLAAALDGGLPLAQATRWVGAADLPSDADDAQAVQWWHRTAPEVARALAVSDRLGSPAAELVRAAARAHRERAALEAELSAGLAGVRATAWLLTALPVVGALLGPALAPSGAAGGREVVAVAVTSGLLLTTLGWWVLHRLVARARARALA